MTEGNPSAKAGFPHIRERPSGSPDGYLLLSLSDSLNDEQELAILACSPDNYRRLPAGRILTVFLTTWFTPISRREGEKNFLSAEAR